MDKEHILREIRRTAEANGGDPLGWRKFFSETGIKSYHWQKYWGDHWNDALGGARYTPNQLKQAYKVSELLEKYAMFTRELGRLPAVGDLRRKANSDSEFPSEKPFRQFGPRSELVRKLSEYCQSH